MMGPILGGIAKLRFSSDVNIVFDGNSLVAGGALSSPSTQSVPAQIKPLAPLNGVVNVVNIGVNGQTISNMRGRGTQYADANYVAGKKNILLPWEGTNFICNTTMTGQAAGDAFAGYCAERLSAHPDWIIVPMTTIPRFDVYGSGWTIAQANAELIAFDNYLKANWRAMGCKALIDVRASGIFTYTGTSMNTAMQPYMLENIHYNPAGGALIAQMAADALKRLPAR